MADGRFKERKEARIAKELAVYLRNSENVAEIHENLRAAKEKYLAAPTGILAIFYSQKTIDAEFDKLIESKETPFNVDQLIIQLINKDDDFIMFYMDELQKKLPNNHAKNHLRSSEIKELKSYLPMAFEEMECENRLHNMKLEFKQIEIQKEQEKQELKKLEEAKLIAQQTLQELDKKIILIKEIEEIEKIKSGKEEALKKYHADENDDGLTRSEIYIVKDHRAEKKEQGEKKEELTGLQGAVQVSALKAKFTERPIVTKAIANKEKDSLKTESIKNDNESFKTTFKERQAQIASQLRLPSNTTQSQSSFKSSVLTRKTTSNPEKTIVKEKPTENVTETAKNSTFKSTKSVWNKLHPEGANAIASLFGAKVPGTTEVVSGKTQEIDNKLSM